MSDELEGTVVCRSLDTCITPALHPAICSIQGVDGGLGGALFCSNRTLTESPLYLNFHTSPCHRILTINPSTRSKKKDHIQLFFV